MKTKKKYYYDDEKENSSKINNNKNNNNNENKEIDDYEKFFESEGIVGDIIDIENQFFNHMQ